MNNLNSSKIKYVFLFLSLLYVLLPIHNQVQALTLEEAGLTAEDVKYLTPSELKEILNPPKSNIPKDALFPALSADLGPLPNTVSCFDYYEFGSVEVNISSGVSSTVAGIPMTFSGKIQNDNKYPVVDGTLYVKIFKLSASQEKNADGPDVVDQFVAIDKISIDGNSSIPFKFDWAIPQYAESGKYKVATFFTSADKFNLLGLSFTDDIIGNSFNFSVDGRTDAVRFNKQTVKINNNEYHFAAYPPRIDKAVEARVEVELVNSTSKTQDIPVVWKLYAWDAQHTSNFITEHPEIVSVPSKGKKTVTYTVKDTSHPVYYLVAESSYMDTKSILGIRFVRDAVDGTRINFPSVTEYPLTEGKETTIFSCLHSMGTADQIEGGKLVLTLRDEQDNVIHQYGYLGPVSGAMMGVKDTFVPKETYNNFTLSAELYQNTKLVDSAVMKYDCESINPTLCATSDISIPIWQYVVMILIVIIAILVLTIYKRRKLPTMILFLMLFMMGTGVFLAPANTAEAKDVQWNKTETVLLKYLWNLGQKIDDLALVTRTPGWWGWEKALENPNITVTYHAKIENVSTGEVINDGAVLPVGTEILLSFIPHISNDIYWFGTGYSQDSPYGEWRANSEPPASVACEKKDFVNRVANIGKEGIADVYIPLVISPPQKEITNLQGLQCGPLQTESDSGSLFDISSRRLRMRCTVTSAGNISPQFNFGATTGKFYYRYDYIKTPKFSLIGPGCYGNNMPLHTINADASGATFDVQVEARTIPYNFTAIEGINNNPPTTPIITGPIQGLTDQSHTFSVRSTDADLDQLKYGIDWNNDTSVDQWIPSTGFVNQDVAQSFPKAWTSIGSYTFKAMAQDSKGATSGWASHTITISLAKLPSVTTNACTDITQHSATSGGNVTSDGGAPVTERGIFWGTSSSPTTNKTPGGSGTGPFVNSFAGLTPDRTYYVRAYATNNAGTSYGSNVLCSTPKDGGRNGNESRDLDVTIEGTGKVVSNPAGISCDSADKSSSCSERYRNQVTVTLTATPANNFVGWKAGASGGCANIAGNICTVVMNNTKSITASFKSAPLDVKATCSEPKKHYQCGVGSSSSLPISSPSKWVWTCTSTSLDVVQCSEDKTPGYRED